MPAHRPSAPAARPHCQDAVTDRRPTAARPGRRYRSAVRPLEDRVSMSASPWSDLERSEVVELLAGATYVENEIVVALEAGSPTLSDILAIESARDAATAGAIASFESLSTPAHGATDPALYRLTIEADADFESTLAAISHWTTVEWASPNFVGGAGAGASSSPGAESAESVIPSGRYDPTFGVGGILTLPSPFGSLDLVKDVARQSDGKLVVVVQQATGGALPDSFVLRYHADGTLDTSFGDGGRVRIFNLAGSSFAVQAVEIAADGKIVLGGDAGFQVYAGRLNVDGSLDESFGVRGAVVFSPASLSSSQYSVGLALQADGSVLVARYGASNVASFVVRFTTAGVLDTSFNGTGYSSLSPANANDTPRDIAVQSDGKIVVVGSRQSSGATDFFAARFLTDGGLDSTFGTGGIAIVNIAGTSTTSDLAYRVALQSDGKIVVAGNVGTFGGDLCVVRFNTDGTLDNTFDGDGRVVTNLGGNETGLALGLTADGRIVVAGSTGTAANPDFAVVRYTTAGALDTTFDGDGFWTRAIGGAADQAVGLVVLPDGRIVLAGTTAEPTNTSDVVLVRLEAAGGLDLSFGSGGIAGPLNLGLGSTNATDTLALADGRILVVGQLFEGINTGGRLAVWRLQADGTLDTSFGTGGMFVSGTASGLFPPRLARQSDGKILVLDAGTSQRLMRLTADGVLDTTFDGDGVLPLNTWFLGLPLTVNVAADNSIVVAGSNRNFTTGFDEVTVVRFTANGAIDSSFGVNGRRLVDVGPAHDMGLALTFQADGKILVTSSELSNANNYYGLVRLNTDGSLDTTFSGDGKIVQNATGFAPQMTAVYARADGRIIMGGYDNGEFTLFGYLSDGTLDTSFGVGGHVATPLHRGGQAYQILEQADGRLIVVGTASKTTDPSLAAVRYSADGVIDTTFDGEDGIVTYYSGDLAFLMPPTAAAFAADGNLLIVGQTVVGDRREAIVLKILTAPEAAGAAPAISALAPQAIAEGGSFSFNFTTTDADTPFEQLRLSAESSDPSLIGPENVTFTHLGAGQWSAAVTARDHRFGSTVLLIKVTDGASTTSQSFTVTVQPINDAPSFVAGADVEASAGVATSLRGWATRIFAGAADEFNQALSFVVEPADPSLFDVGPTISADGTLAFTAKGSAAGQSTIVTVRLHDDGGVAGGGVDTSAPQTFTLRIGQGPVIGAIADQTIAEGAATGQLNFTVLDADTAAGSVTVTAASGNTAILTASGLVLTNLGSGNYRIVATPAADRYGSVVVTVTASDGVRINTRQFTVNVTPVNDVPSFAKGVDQFVGNTAGPQAIARWAKNMSAGAQEASQQLSFLVTVDDPSLFAVAPAIAADGTLTFTPAAGKSGLANVTVRLEDDGGTAGGGVNTSAPQSFVIRVLDVGSAAGAPDPTLGGDGSVSTWSSFNAGSVSRDVAVQADGKIVVTISDAPGVGTRLLLVRLNADGSTDTTFGVGGYAAYDLISTETAAGLKIGADGKIYVGLSGSGDYQVVRFLADGALDASFGAGGVATAVNAGLNETTGGIAIQADGRIVVVGSAFGDLGAARFTSAGMLDATFGVGGLFRYDLGTSSASLSDVALRNDGSIVAAGRGQLDGSPSSTDVVVIRLTAGGVLDTGFSGDGIVLASRMLTGSIRTDQAERVVIDGRDRILVAGASSSAFALLRLEADGSRDTSFGADGWVVKDFSSTLALHGLATTHDGRIVAVGEYGDEDELAVVQYLADGSIDTSFDHDGLKLFSFGPGEDEAFGVTVDAQGRVVFVGQATGSANAGAVVVRLAADGSNDTSFDGDGIRMIGIPASRQYASVVRTADGKYLVGGVSYQVSGTSPTGRLSVTRYLADGTLDASFGVGGTALHPQLGAGSAMIALQSDGKILAVPGFGASGTSGLVRFNADGTPDTSFAGDASAAFPTSFTSHGVTVQADGKIVVVGSQSSNFAVVRYNADGTLDTSFSGDGLSTLDIGGTETGRAIALLPDGRMYVAGFTTASAFDYVLIRFLADGTLDTSFDFDGWVRTTIGSSSNGAFSLLAMPDGRIVAGGTAFNSPTSNDWGLVRYNANGSLDSTFDGDGKMIFSPGFGLDTLGEMRLQADGKLVVVGSAVNGTLTDTVVARFLTNGKLDPTFAGSGVLYAPQGAGIDAAQGLTIDPDGRIVIVGYAETSGRYEGTLIRLENEVDVAPQVAGVYVKGSTWNAGYLDHLNSTGVGDPEGAALGFALPSGATQTTVTLPWSNVDRITLRFDRDVVVTSADALKLYDSTGAVIAATSFRYVDGRTVEWTVPTIATSKYWLHVDSSKVTGISELQLDGDWETSTSTWGTGSGDGSGDGTAGGNFNFRFNVLSGDFDSSGTVAFGEIGQARLQLGKTTAAGDFNYRQDYDGSGSITFGEIGQARTRLGASLSSFAEPPPPPGAGGSPESGENFAAVSDFAAQETLDPRESAEADPTGPSVLSAGAFDPTLDGDGLASFAGLPAVNGSGDAVVVQSDGKTLVAGTFTPGINTGVVVARYHADGTLDATFGTAGIAYVDGIDSGATVVDLELAADGRIYVAVNDGNRFTVVRRNADGSADSTFGTGGLVSHIGFGADVTAGMTLQADGKVILVGSISSDLGAIRFRVDGTLDTTFGTGGTFRRSQSASVERLTDVAVRSDGKIVAVGFATGSGQVVVRLTSGGALDTTFDGDGVLLLSPTLSPDGEADRVLIDGSNRILVGGRAGGDLVVARLNADGTFDASFAGVGYVRYTAGATFADVRLAAADGRITAAGTAGSSAVVRRFLDDGSHDLAFNGTGLVTVPFGAGTGDIGGVALAADGRAIITGRGFVDGRTNAYLARIALNGTVDSSFGGDGFAILEFGDYSRTFSTVARQADGKYVVGGTRYSGTGGQRTIVSRHHADGSLDLSFGVDGYATAWPTVVGQAAVAIDSNGRIVALAVPTGSTSGLVRFNSTGALDPAFAGDGVVDLPSSITPYAMTVQADGKILVAGRQSGNFAVFRYNVDGTLDTTFSGDGMLNFDVGGSSDFVRAVAVATDGKIILGGYRSNGNNDAADDFAVARVNADGTLDTTFDGDGWNRVAIGTGMDFVTSLAIQPDGRIMLGGSSRLATFSETNWALVRFNVNGSLDTSFDGDGILSLSLGVGAETIYGLAAQADGRIVAVGLMQRGGLEDTVVARFLADGSLDPTFGVGGMQSTSLSPQDDRASDVRIDPDGRIVVVGRREVDGHYEGTIVRLLNDDVAPTVSGVYVRGSTWNAAYLAHLDATGVGDSEGDALGFALPAGAAQLTATISWSNVDRITIRFDRDVVVTSPDALALYDSAGTVITATAFRYVDVRTVEWTVPVIATSKYWLHVDSSKVTGISELQLDGDWETSTSTWGTGSGDGSGDGAAGGNFNFRFNVLSGDFDSSGTVAFGEIGQARLQLGKTTAVGDYNYRQDYDGSGSITFGEIGQARLRLGASLSSFAEPPPPPGTGESLEEFEAVTAQESFDPRESVGLQISVGDDASSPSEDFANVEAEPIVGTSSFVVGSIFLRAAAVGLPANGSPSTVTPAPGTVRRTVHDFPHGRFERPSTVVAFEHRTDLSRENRIDDPISGIPPWRRLRRKVEAQSEGIAASGAAVVADA